MPARVVNYSTYLGGSSADGASGIAVDGAGNAYVTGYTTATDFPTTAGAFQTTKTGSRSVFVTKLNATGTGLVYSTYLGGSGLDDGAGIAVDGAGNAYVTGLTYSPDFPTTPGAFQTHFPAPLGQSAAFATKLNPMGTGLVYSTYLGGNVSAEALGITVDGAGNAYLTGCTSSTDFPTTPDAFQARYPAGSQLDYFVTKLNATGTALVYSTYLGGSMQDSGSGNGITVPPNCSANCNAYVTGYTDATDFPTTNGAFQTRYGGGGGDVFVTELNGGGTALVFSTYLGGTGTDDGNGITVDRAGNVYVTGATNSRNFPTIAGAFQTRYGGGTSDAFVTKLNATGTALVYSTYLGGGADDYGNAIALDQAGNIYVTGVTTSRDFPTTANAFQTGSQGGGDAFVAKFTAQPAAPTVSPTSVAWDLTSGGLNFFYNVGGSDLMQDVPVDLYWAGGPQWSDRFGRVSGDNSPLFVIPSGTPARTQDYGPIHVDASVFLHAPDAPAGTLDILVVADPTNVLGNFEPSRNVRAVPDVRVSVRRENPDLPLSEHTIEEIKKLLRSAGQDPNRPAVVSSTVRTPQEQAQAMYDNLEMGKHVHYRPPGQAVIDRYYEDKDAGLPEEQIVADMQEIIDQDPYMVSHHCADTAQWARLQVVDIRPSSTTNPGLFSRMARQAKRRGELSRFLDRAQGDPAFHLEIPQSTPPLREGNGKGFLPGGPTPASDRRSQPEPDWAAGFAAVPEQPSSDPARALEGRPLVAGPAEFDPRRADEYFRTVAGAFDARRPVPPRPRPLDGQPRPGNLEPDGWRADNPLPPPGIERETYRQAEPNVDVAVGG